MVETFLTKNISKMPYSFVQTWTQYYIIGVSGNNLIHATYRPKNECLMCDPYQSHVL